MGIYDSKTYQDDLKLAVQSVPGIENLKHSSVLITGAAGLIGSYITDLLLEYNRLEEAGIKVYACGRSMKRLRRRFPQRESDGLVLIQHDVNDPPDFDFGVDYIIHAASNAFPAVFAKDPVGTILSNIQGTKYLLDYGLQHQAKRLLFVSSGEVYGQGDLSLDSFEESYGGYVDPTQPRSCYPNSKRTAETLCASYTKQFGLDTVMVRPCHTYGPNATAVDNRANVQFINNAVAGEDIVMKSAGTQMRSYAYIADSASAILTVLVRGQSCEAYNIANPQARSTIAEYAKAAAAKAGVQVIFEDPDAVALAQQSPIAKQVLNTDKLLGLGWQGRYTVEEGISHTIDIIHEMKDEG